VRNNYFLTVLSEMYSIVPLLLVQQKSEEIK